MYDYTAKFLLLKQHFPIIDLLWCPSARTNAVYLEFSHPLGYSGFAVSTENYINKLNMCIAAVYVCMSVYRVHFAAFAYLATVVTDV